MTDRTGTRHRMPASPAVAMWIATTFNAFLEQAEVQLFEEFPRLVQVIQRRKLERALGRFDRERSGSAWPAARYLAFAALLGAIGFGCGTVNRALMGADKNTFSVLALAEVRQRTWTIPGQRRKRKAWSFVSVEKGQHRRTCPGAPCSGLSSGAPVQGRVDRGRRADGDGRVPAQGRAAEGPGCRDDLRSGGGPLPWPPRQVRDAAWALQALEEILGPRADLKMTLTSDHLRSEVRKTAARRQSLDPSSPAEPVPPITQGIAQEVVR